MHTQTIAITVRAAAADAMITARRADPETIAAQRRRWYGGKQDLSPVRRRFPALKTLPIAVLVASYTPGTASFAAGEAAFTVTVVVLFNPLVPAGWQVGLLRVEDVAIGCAVSLVIGILFWPTGAAAVVGDDLADAFRRGAARRT